MDEDDVPSPPAGFDWDPLKYVQNSLKHGIRFDDVVRVFADPLGFDFEVQNSQDEGRWVWLGALFGIVLYTVYTLRDDGVTTRLISSRRANKREVDAYYQGS